MARTVVLISCVSKKLPRKARAEQLYLGPLFRMSLEYARSLKPDAIYILSAKYGLLDLHTEVEPYDVTLNRMNSAQRQAWAQTVIAQLSKKADLQHDHFIFLAGQNYRRNLLPYLASYQAPLEGLTIGRQLQWLKRMTG